MTTTEIESAGAQLLALYHTQALTEKALDESRIKLDAAKAENDSLQQQWRDTSLEIAKAAEAVLRAEKAAISA